MLTAAPAGEAKEGRDWQEKAKERVSKWMEKSKKHVTVHIVGQF